MRLKSMLIPAVALVLFPLVQPAVGVTEGGCDLPQNLQREIANTYPWARLVSLSDLEEDDRKFFQSDHADDCPGLVKVDFYGDGKPTFALALIPKSSTRKHTE